MDVNKKFVPFVVVFAVLLLLPFTVQTVSDVRNMGEASPRLLSFDIFKDLFCTPFQRESKMNESALALETAWRDARESIAGGEEIGESLETVMAALSDLESAVFTVNGYNDLDSSEFDYKLLKQADTLLAALEDKPLTFTAVDSCLKVVIASYRDFSLGRAMYGVKHYGLWTSRYLRAFEKKVEDENALVLAARPKYQLAVWKLFSDPGEKVVLGDKWLFYRQDVEFLVQPSPFEARSAKLDNPISAITTFRDQLKEKGVELLVVVVPGKPSIYPERLTGTKVPASREELFGHGKKILDSLTALGFNTVDLYTPLWSAKAGDEKFGALYLDDDTHWTPRGAELAAGVIAAKVHKMSAAGEIDIGEASMNYVANDSLADRMGDIGEMSGLNKFNVFAAQQVVGHVVQQQNVTQRVVPAVDSTAKDSVVYDTTTVPFKDDFRKARILILGDSFSRIYQTDSPVNAGWISHFAKNMGRPVASIVSDGGASTLVREKLARKSGVLKGKKLVIWEFVERDLRFGAEGWKDVEF
ncbi:MAG: hypothetical protein MJZ26_01945 [Fibrobacter sp.]|nr:hypothetical protein [Fibrobacter sp.]